MNVGEKILYIPLWGTKIQIFSKTQNPPLATACRFESGHRHQKRSTSPTGVWIFFGVDDPNLGATVRRPPAGGCVGAQPPRAAALSAETPATGTTSEQALYRLLRLFTKVRARSCRCSSFPNRTRYAGLRFGFGANLETKASILFRCSQKRSTSPTGVW